MVKPTGTTTSSSLILEGNDACENFINAINTAYCCYPAAFAELYIFIWTKAAKLALCVTESLTLNQSESVPI